MKIKPKGGVNLRLHAHDVSKNQFILMQNVDMTHDEHYTQIFGSIKYHGTNIGSAAATHIGVCYNNDLLSADVLACVDDRILKKKQGANEFDTANPLITGLTTNAIQGSVNIQNKQYFAHPVDGIYEYDGASIVTKVNDILLKDIIISKETNRCFGPRADIPNAYNWTDDLATIGGVPNTWNPLNTDIVPTTDGDSIEKMLFLRGRLVFFMTNSIWIEYVNGAPTNWRYEKIATSVGLIAPKTAKQVGSEIWFLGHSPSVGTGIYAFDGNSVKLLSYDVEPILLRINPSRIQNACAEYVDNRYKLSFALDGAIENDTTLHIDTINTNTETEFPCIYGPHTYGFNASAILNSTRFSGEHIWSAVFGGASWIFKTDNIMTQHAVSASTPGDLIPTVLITPIYHTEKGKEGEYDETWMKRYEKIYNIFPSQNYGSCTIDLLRGFLNEVYANYQQYMDGQNYSLGGLNLNSNALNFEDLTISPKLQDILSNAIQFKVTNYDRDKKFVFDSVTYDFRPVRRIKEVGRVHI